MRYGIDNPLRGRLSTPQTIAETLRQAIIEGKLLAGESLRQEELARQFEVSCIPVREALRQLESEGWIAFLRNKGAFVAPLSIEEVHEVYEIIAALESMALRFAIPRHTPTSLQKAEKVLHSTGNSSPDHLDRNRNFHRALCAPAARPRLLNLIDIQRDRAQRYLRLYLVMPVYKQKTEREHWEILRACRDQDVDQAVRRLENHLIETGQTLVRYLEQHVCQAVGSIREDEALVALQQQAVVRERRRYSSKAKKAGPAVRQGPS